MEEEQLEIAAVGGLEEGEDLTSSKDLLENEKKLSKEQVMFSSVIDINTVSEPSYHYEKKFHKQNLDDDIPSYHKLAWFAFLFFFPVGIIALVRSCQVKYALRHRDYVKAEDMSDSTRLFTTLSIIFGIIVICMGTAILLGMAADV